MDWYNELAEITYKKELTVKIGENSANIKWEINDSTVKNPHYEINIDGNAMTSDRWNGENVYYSFKKEIGDYNCTLIFNDGLGGIVSASTIVHFIDGEDLNGTGSKNVPGFPIFTMTIFSIIGIIIIKKRIKLNK